VADYELIGVTGHPHNRSSSMRSSRNSQAGTLIRVRSVTIYPKDIICAASCNFNAVRYTWHYSGYAVARRRVTTPAGREDKNFQNVAYSTSSNILRAKFLARPEGAMMP
jgi:hypothetical protein